MHKENILFIPPNDPNQRIWRYIDLARFLDLLQTNTLFFPRADQFNDAFEGSITKLTKIDRGLIAEIFKRRGTPNAENLPQVLEEGLLQARKETFISCWHMNDVESQAMWSIYAREANSIAIQSTYSRFISSLKQEIVDVFIGTVKYVNYDNALIPESNHFLPFLHKRESFKHENELRAIVWLIAEQQTLFSVLKDFATNGIRIKIDVSELIEKVYVSPAAPLWFCDVVHKVVTQTGIPLEVIQSRLSENPIF